MTAAEAWEALFVQPHTLYAENWSLANLMDDLLAMYSDSKRAVAEEPKHMVDLRADVMNILQIEAGNILNAKSFIEKSKDDLNAYLDTVKNNDRHEVLGFTRKVVGKKVSTDKCEFQMTEFESIRKTSDTQSQTDAGDEECTLSVLNAYALSLRMLRYKIQYTHPEAVLRQLKSVLSNDIQKDMILDSDTDSGAGYSSETEESSCASSTCPGTRPGSSDKDSPRSVSGFQDEE